MVRVTVKPQCQDTLQWMLLPIGMQPLTTANACRICYFPSLSSLSILHWILCRAVLAASIVKVVFLIPLLYFSVMELLPSTPATWICCSQEWCQCSQWSCVWLWLWWALWYPRKVEKVRTFHIVILSFLRYWSVSSYYPCSERHANGPKQKSRIRKKQQAQREKCTFKMCHPKPEGGV